MHEKLMNISQFTMQTVNPIRFIVHHENNMSTPLFDDYINVSFISDAFKLFDDDKLNYPKGCVFYILKPQHGNQEDMMDVLLSIVKHFPIRFDAFKVSFNMEDVGCVNQVYAYDRETCSFDCCEITEPEIFDQVLFQSVNVIRLSSELNSKQSMIVTEQTIEKSNHLKIVQHEYVAGFQTVMFVKFTA